MNDAAPALASTTAFGETQQICRAALRALLTMGIEVAEASARMAVIERLAVEVLGGAVEAAARGIMAAPKSMEAAIEAGRVADASEASRDAIASRLGSITVTQNMAARSVRRTAMLMLRVERPLHAEQDTVPGGTRRTRAPGQAERERGERMDDPEREDEIGDRPAEEVVRDICRDLGVLTVPGEEGASRPPMPELVVAALAQAGLLARPSAPFNEARARARPVVEREPET